MHLACIKKTMGQNASQLEKEIGAEQVPINEHFFGLVNFGNTCYCNSVIQALYFCRPFRDKVLGYRQQLKKSGSTKENLLTCLADLFHNIATQKKRVGTIAPKKFVGRLKKENELFDNYMQQDAHEFLNYLLNTIADILVDEKRREKSQPSQQASSSVFYHHQAPSSLHPNRQGQAAAHVTGYNFNSTSNSVRPPGNIAAPMATLSLHADVAESTAQLDAMALNKNFQHFLLQNENLVEKEARLHATENVSTWVHDIFQGTLTNETRCLNCESVSSKDEDFLDLSVDVEQNTSITHCLRVFSNMETLCQEQKYYCDYCSSKQEAQKRMRIKKLPLILALHLKRFKFLDQFNRYTKLSYRVLFPLELRLFNTSDDALNGDRLYNLVAVVVHCGSTPNRGHYITVVKSHGLWLLFDDDIVDKIDPNNIEDFFGLTVDSSFAKNSESAYILFYQAASPGDPL